MDNYRIRSLLYDRSDYGCIADWVVIFNSALYDGCTSEVTFKHELTEWCEQSCNGEFVILRSGEAFFEYEEEAMLCHLRFL